jgi:FimV-like protein
MITSILNSYLPLLLFIALGSLFIFILGLYFILKPESTSSQHEDLQHLSAIAGDDLITTQLDLARAYIETGRKKAAEPILAYIMKQGNAEQKQEAKQLKKVK